MRRTGVVASVAALWLLPAAAEDIDLYAGASAVSPPNVLFFLDNSSNWSANNQAWAKADVLAKCNDLSNVADKDTGRVPREICKQYVEKVFGTSTSLVQGQVELRALKLVLEEAVCPEGSALKLNAGTMMFNPNGSVDSNSVVGGYIRKAIKPLDAENCKTLADDLATIDAKIQTPDFKGPSSAEYGAALYEAFKYFGGWTNPAGTKPDENNTAGSPTGATGFGPVRYSNKIELEDPDAFADTARTTYKSPITELSTCGKNYIILIGNTFPNQEYGTNTNAVDGKGTPRPTNTLLSRLDYTPYQLYPTPLTNNEKTNVRFADEWAKFLYTTDVSEAAGTQNVGMFTIDVYNKSPSAAQGRLLKSMAEQDGAGGYYAIGGDLYALINALKDALAQIAAVNSVFASASLPVSVNAQGTFLNQVFMGVFRPDANLGQRWAGNLKQYRFALDTNSALYLADATTDPSTGLPRAAVDSKNTGFIQNCATSFWTSDTQNYWESVSGSSPSACTTQTTNAYSDEPDGPLVERGAASQRLRALGHANRNIRTCKDASCKSGSSYALIDFTKDNVTTIAGVDDPDTLVQWARGQNTGDGIVTVKTEDSNKTTAFETTLYGKAETATRPTVHGEVVHSRPLAVNYGVNGVDDVVVFYGAGDGMFRAVNGNQTGTGAGDELWAFVAPEHWSKLDRVRKTQPLIELTSVKPTGSKPKDYFFDGSIGGYQERTSTSVDKLWIYPTMRRGGRMVYAFDVTAKPGKNTNQPVLMWKFGCYTNASDNEVCVGGQTNENQIGQTWSTPAAVRVEGWSVPLVVFGAGYDTCEDTEDPITGCGSASKGRGVFVMDAKDGPGSSHYRFIDLGSSAGRVIADMATVDVNGDGYTDVIYAADTRGNLWRINTSDPANNFKGITNLADWPVVLVAQVSVWNASDKSQWRKFMNAPSVVMLGTQATVLIGSGDREKPLSGSVASKTVNRFYGIRDDVTITKQSDITVAIGYDGDTVNLKDMTDVPPPVDPLSLSAYQGWYRDLLIAQAPYEQVVTTPLTIGGVTYFSTYQALDKSDASKNVCTNLGTARAYQIDFQTGTQLVGQDLVTEFLSQGIPPSPVGGVVLIDGKSVPFLIGGPGPTVLSPKKVVPKVRADRRPVYRYQRIDG